MIQELNHPACNNTSHLSEDVCASIEIREVKGGFASCLIFGLMFSCCGSTVEQMEVSIQEWDLPEAAWAFSQTPWRRQHRHHLPHTMRRILRKGRTARLMCSP
jgi:hypothetical protein